MDREVRRRLGKLPVVHFYKDLPRNLWGQGSSWLRRRFRPVSVPLTEAEQHCVTHLCERGYTIREGYWPREQALAVGRELERRVDVPEDQELDCGATIRVRFRSRAVGGIRRIYDVERLLPELEDVRFDPSYHRSAMAFCGVPLRSRVLVYQLDKRSGEADGEWHVDTFYPEMKALLLLQDVDESCGPTAYLEGSHRFHLFRLRHEFFGYRPGRNARFFSSAEVRRWRERQVLLCGSAGTLILFDGRGLHRATAQRGSSRSLLMNYVVRA